MHSRHLDLTGLHILVPILGLSFGLTLGSTGCGSESSRASAQDSDDVSLQGDVSADLAIGPDQSGALRDSGFSTERDTGNDLETDAAGTTDAGEGPDTASAPDTGAIDANTLDADWDDGGTLDADTVDTGNIQDMDEDDGPEADAGTDIGTDAGLDTSSMREMGVDSGSAADSGSPGTCEGFGNLPEEPVPTETEALCTRRLHECGRFDDPLLGNVDCGGCPGAEVCVWNRCEPRCGSDQVEGTTDGLAVHVLNQFADADISDNRVPVTVTESVAPTWRAEEWRPRTDLTDKALGIELGDLLASGQYTISIRLIPWETDQEAQVLTAGDLTVVQDGMGLAVSSGDVVLGSVDTDLQRFDCNHFAVSVDETTVTVYANGHTTTHTRTEGDAWAAGDQLQVGPYPGRVWDVRVYDRVLSGAEVTEVASRCVDERVAAAVHEGYAEYMCAVYHCQFWPTGTTDVTVDNLEYYIHRQDEMRERNALIAAMYPEGDMCGYMLQAGSWNDLILSDGIRRGFVRVASFAAPASQHWLHENFHSYQGQMKRYSGVHGTKWVLESTASWGSQFNRPGVRDTLLGYYTLQPHLPLFVTQSTDHTDAMPEGLTSAGQGGHQYGAHIFEIYLTEHVTGPALIGLLYNDDRSGNVNSTSALLDAVADAGGDMQEALADFAARVATWDFPQEDDWRASEVASASRLAGAVGDDWPPEEIDNKHSVSYGTDGTGGVWTSVLPQHLLGNWAYTSYQVTIEPGTIYAISLRMDAANPVGSEYRARVVTYDSDSGVRRYYDFPVAPLGEASTLEVETCEATELYFVVASVPTVLDSPWDFHEYEYAIEEL